MSSLVEKLLLLLILSLYLFLHFKASFSFPIPWPDEVVFYLQAKAMACCNSLFVPALHQRTLFWMPPGYMVLTGLIFKVTGSSISMARLISACFLMGSFLLMAYKTTLTKKDSCFLIILGFFFLNRQSIVAGNIARMEALELLLSLAGFFLLMEGRATAAMGFLVLCVLVHPVGLFFLFGGIFWMVLRRKELSENFRYWELLIFIPAVVLGLWYGVYVLQHLDYFIADMKYQSGTRNMAIFFKIILGNAQLVFIALFSFLFYITWKKKLEVLKLWLLLSFCLWLAKTLGQGYWYGIYNSVSMCILVYVLWSILNKWLEGTSWKRWKIVLTKVFTIALVVAAGVFLHFFEIPFLSRVSWSGMRMEEKNIPYCSTKDIAAVIASAEKIITTTDSVQLYFLPEGDGLLFEQVLPGQWIQIFPVFEKRQPDYFLIHNSRYLDEGSRESIDAVMKKSSNRKLLYGRDSTELWYLVRPSEL